MQQLPTLKLKKVHLSAESLLQALWIKINEDREARRNIVDKENKRIKQLEWELKAVKDQRDKLLKLFAEFKKLLEMYGLIW